VSFPPQGVVRQLLPFHWTLRVRTSRSAASLRQGFFAMRDEDHNLNKFFKKNAVKFRR
jgi:hypothetical protein